MCLLCKCPKGRRRLWVKNKSRRLWIKNDDVWLKRNVIKSEPSNIFTASVL
jgi:hypothetical protein